MQIGPASFEIDEWLRELGMESYKAAFHEHNIEPDVLVSLTAEDLKELGVVAVGHRRRLMNAIEALRESRTADTPTIGRKSPAPARRTSQYERRHLTIVFCDLVGSTHLSDSLDAEELSDVITDYQSAVTNVVARFDGFVHQYQGDGVLAYFSAGRRPTKTTRSGRCGQASR